MHILLINSNPVVSRLLALCTRDQDIILEEVETIISLKRHSYDIVFVDDERYQNEVLALDTHVSASKKVLFSNEKSDMNIFDLIIQKPFLPSQITEVLENVEDVEPQTEEKQGFIFPLASEATHFEVEAEEETKVLDVDEIEKIKSLLVMEDVEESTVLSDEEIEAKKIEVIKEQLIADGLEIVDEEDIVEELSAKDTINIFDIVEEIAVPQVKKHTSKDKKFKKKSKKKKSVAFTEEEREYIEDAVQVAIASLKRKKMKKLLKGKKVKISIQLEEQK
jgi:hypothetical protein